MAKTKRIDPRTKYPKLLVNKDRFTPDYVATELRRGVGRMFRDVDKNLPAAIRQLLQAVHRRGWEAVAESREEAFYYICVPLNKGLPKYLTSAYGRTTSRGGRMPKHCFVLHPGPGKALLLSIRSFPECKTEKGSGLLLRKTLTWDDKQYQIVMTPHAVDRLMERVASHESYMQLAIDSMYFLRNAPYRPWLKPDGTLNGFVAWDKLGERDDELRSLLTQMDDSVQTGDYCRAFYAPVEIAGDKLVVMTVLRPGYRGTPERSEMERLKFCRKTLDDEASQANWNELIKNDMQPGWLKAFNMFVPQIAPGGQPLPITGPRQIVDA